MSYEDDTVFSAVLPPGAPNSDSDEACTPGPQRCASFLPSLDPKDGLFAAVISATVKAVTERLGGDIPCTDPLKDVPVPPSRSTLIGCVLRLDVERKQSFSSDAERKAAVLPVLGAIREAILALPEALFKWKLMPLVERIDAFSE